MRTSIALAIAAVLFSLPATAQQAPQLADPGDFAPTAPSPDGVYEEAEPIASPVVVNEGESLCCPANVVGSRAKRSARKMYDCHGDPIEVMVCVENPACCGQYYAVPLCVPCCCVGDWRVCDQRTGLLGRGKVDVVWPCGFEAKITFLGGSDVRVVYSGG